eukprot:g24502.t1
MLSMAPQHLISTMDIHFTLAFLHTEGLKALCFFVSWLAKGTRMGLTYACLFVGFVEQSLFNHYTGTIPHLFLRYTDDCIGAASCSHEELKQFINFANTFHRTLTFTWTISDTSLASLDLSLGRSFRDTLISSKLPTNFYIANSTFPCNHK